MKIFQAFQVAESVALILLVSLLIYAIAVLEIGLLSIAIAILKYLQWIDPFTRLEFDTAVIVVSIVVLLITLLSHLPGSRKNEGF